MDIESHSSNAVMTLEKGWISTTTSIRPTNVSQLAITLFAYVNYRS